MSRSAPAGVNCLPFAQLVAINAVASSQPSSCLGSLQFANGACGVNGTLRISIKLAGSVVPVALGVGSGEGNGERLVVKPGTGGNPASVISGSGLLIEGIIFVTTK